MDQSAIVTAVAAAHLQQIPILMSNQLSLMQRKQTKKFILQHIRQRTNQDFLTIYALTYFLRRPREIGLKPRRKGWFAHLIVYRGEEDFFESFKMKKETFRYICDMLRPTLQPKPNPLTTRKSIAVEEQVAIAVYYLGCCAELRVIAEVFGHGKSTVWKWVRTVCQAIVDVMLPIWIKMPDEEECEKIAQLFEARSRLPNIIGAVDGSQISISPPKEGNSDYINRKGWSSLNLQALIDHDLL